MSAITGGRTPAQARVDRIRGDLPVCDLETLAGKDERQTWDARIERYTPLVWPICLRHRLDGADVCSKAPSWTAVITASGQLRIPCERLTGTAWLGQQHRPEGTPK
jgi:hypothetical protein